jgi:digeranylgeranylglycerophospholipid reductase
MKKDVAVVGCSGAGLLAAYELARKGASVQVFDSAEELTPASRTLIVTSKLKELCFPLQNSAVINEIRGFELFADGKMATIPFVYPDLVIDRSLVIRSLASMAKAEGAEIHMGHRFLRFNGSNGKGLNFSVQKNGNREEEEMTARVVIGADGATSKVAESAGWPGLRLAQLTQAVVNLPKKYAPDLTKIWFIPDETPYFFWLIPESRQRGVLGLIGNDKTASCASLERFLEKKNLEPLEFQEAQVPLWSEWLPVSKKMGDGEVYLVGDAAGHVKVTTVGGVVSGFVGALGVAEAVLNGGDSRRLRSLRLELTIHRWLRKLLHRFSQEDYVKLLGLLNTPAKEVLKRIPRDEASRMVRHLLLRQPRLVLFGLRMLLNRKASR